MSFSVLEHPFPVLERPFLLCPVLSRVPSRILSVRGRPVPNFGCSSPSRPVGNPNFSYLINGLLKLGNSSFIIFESPLSPTAVAISYFTLVSLLCSVDNNFCCAVWTRSLYLVWFYCQKWAPSKVSSQCETSTRICTIHKLHTLSSSVHSAIDIFVAYSTPSKSLIQLENKLKLFK